jgi:hypothetical protein
MNAGGTETGWYFSRRGGPPGQRSGPFTREQLQTLARSGALTRYHLVWGPDMADWLPAGQIPGLMPAPMRPVPPPLPAQTTHPAGPWMRHAPPPVPVTRRRPGRPWLLPLVLTLVIVIAGAGVAATGLWSSGRGSNETNTSTAQSSTGPANNSPMTSSAPSGPQTAGQTDVGKVEIKLPDRSKLVQTADFGEVPVNQVVVVMADGKSRSDAEAVAGAIKGTIVGELEFLGSYQIETAATTEAELKGDLTTARGMPGVETAFPNGEEFPCEEI